MVVSRHGHDAAGFSLHQTSKAACHPPSHSGSHHRVTSDLDAFEVAQSGALCTADVVVVHFRERIPQETQHAQPLAASLRAMSNIPSATLSNRA
jgi:hypothetical protein